MSYQRLNVLNIRVNGLRKEIRKNEEEKKSGEKIFDVKNN